MTCQSALAVRNIYIMKNLSNLKKTAPIFIADIGICTRDECAMVHDAPGVVIVEILASEVRSGIF
jgi:hypothetical protein